MIKSTQAHSLSLIIPCYNEAEVLPAVMPEIIEFCSAQGYHLILVNDGSKDETQSILESTASGHDFITIVRHKLNRGYGGALKSGLGASQTEYSIFMDADGQHHLSDVSKLYQKILENDADMIVGSRKGQPGNKFRSLGKAIIRFIAKLMMTVPIYDINSGMKIFRTELGQKYLHLYPDSMAFSDIICLVFLHNRHLVLEEPISIQARKGGKSTIGIQTAFKTIMEIINIVTMFNPLKLFLPVAALMFCFGLAWGARFVILGRGVSIGSSMLLIMSVVVFLLGLIAEQLAAIRRNGQ